MVTAVGADSFIEELLSDIDYDDNSQSAKLYPDFKVRVGVVKMAAPRHSRFEYFLNMGQSTIDKVFNQEIINDKILTLVFPERWMSVHEQQGCMSALAKHPSAKNIDRIDILTSSPLLIGNFHGEQIRILTWPDDEKHNGMIQK